MRRRPVWPSPAVTRILRSEGGDLDVLRMDWHLWTTGQYAVRVDFDQEMQVGYFNPTKINESGISRPIHRGGTVNMRQEHIYPQSPAYAILYRTI